MTVFQFEFAHFYYVGRSSNNIKFCFFFCLCCLAVVCFIPSTSFRMNIPC